jgi:hypothetical protein
MRTPMTSYTPDEVLELAPAIERMGGALLPEKCEGRFTGFKIPGTEKHAAVRTCNCQNQSMYVLPYEPTDPEGKTTTTEFRARGAGYTRACLHCDLIGHWPNFENVLEREDD